MIYVSHRLDEIFRIADRVAVLRDGQMVGMRPIGHTTPEELVSLIVGRKAREIARPPVQEGPAILTVTGLKTPAVGPSVSRSSGASCWPRGPAWRGARGYRAGAVRGDPACRAGPAGREGARPADRADRHAVGHRAGGARPHRRKRGAGTGDPRERFSEPPRPPGGGCCRCCRPGAKRRWQRPSGAAWACRPTTPRWRSRRCRAATSRRWWWGRWLDSGRRLLITEDPTAGVDVGAKAEIYHLLYQALAGGMGVLVVSTDLRRSPTSATAPSCFRAGCPWRN